MRVLTDNISTLFLSSFIFFLSWFVSEVFISNAELTLTAGVFIFLFFRHTRSDVKGQQNTYISTVLFLGPLALFIN